MPSIEPAKDGYVGITMVTGQQWLDFAAMVDCPEFTEIPQLRFQIGRWDYRDWIRERIDPWMRERTVAEIVELGQLFRLPLAPLGNGSTIPRHGSPADARGVCRQPGRLPAAPTAVADVASRARRRCAARPRSVTRDGESALGAKRIRVSPASARAPLAGVRVVDFTAFWAGPAATHALAAFGADVVKVESIQRPDGIRYSGGMRTDVDDWWEYGWVFHAMNTNKRSVTLDLQIRRRSAAVQGADRQADVVIENFSPRVMDHSASTPTCCWSSTPTLVVVRMPAFGLDRPVAGPGRLRADDGADRGPRVGDGPARRTAGRTARCLRSARGRTCGVRGARRTGVRDRTGRGQLVEVPMIETVLNVTAVQTMEFEVFGSVMERRGNRGHTGRTQDIYRCAGDDSWIAVSVRTDDERAALVETHGRLGCRPRSGWRHSR